MAGASCKRRDSIREKHVAEVAERVAAGTLDTGRGKNQELGLKRPGDMRWSSHYTAIRNMIKLFPSVAEILQEVSVHRLKADQKAEAKSLKAVMTTFDFILLLFLMSKILGYTHDLCQALQRRDQDIVNAVTLVKTTKTRL